MLRKIEMRDAVVAFDDAIRNAGELSVDRDAPNWAGHFMYMGTEVGEREEYDLFKHRETRQYMRIRYEL